MLVKHRLDTEYSKVSVGKGGRPDFLSEEKDTEDLQGFKDAASNISTLMFSGLNF